MFRIFAFLFNLINFCSSLIILEDLLLGSNFKSMFSILKAAMESFKVYILALELMFDSNDVLSVSEIFISMTSISL